MTAPAQRKRELSIGPVPPWQTLITVDSVTTNHGRLTTLPHDHVFEVAAEWNGPPAIGFPPSRTPVLSRDVYVLDNYYEAVQLAHRAAEAFRQGGEHPPDLRELARAK